MFRGVAARSDFNVDFETFRQWPKEFNFDRQSYQCCHATVRDGWSEIDMNGIIIVVNLDQGLFNYI